MGISPSAALLFEALCLLLFVLSTSAVTVRLPLYRNAIVFALPCFPIAKEQSRQHISQGISDTRRWLANGQAQKVLHGATGSYPAAAGPLHECNVIYHLLFTSNVTLGTPPQPFIARIDINWADMFVPSAPCMLDPDRDCVPFHKFNSSQSSTYIATIAFTAIDYEAWEPRAISPRTRSASAASALQIKCSKQLLIGDLCTEMTGHHWTADLV
ncbi:uncharacterized protein BDZ99DRAFT_535129 [Mytilinidion resinicola]|uniref:Peptidase A1 domain-containing protein n=1 Tax=Mytilinidion resinicola TaxID=574789 RepID=A0A6A6YFR6_9PEZI|nr:uncharacterized protein BDZ99DRAFT_535129 [Mytilinidion resinicola]KAF2807651.1 hypothetical protein BDZ99DRAFT_535129 [Mytilinidion resinicola]